ncbi:Phosphoribosylanthranilate isomerase [Methylophaga frappieri]|uniref:N-(5'-phosphoribosyl)anthranilate isomerase n=1 Tax=Methylophaga frappieri (strain ATCC BAA-2434 / DSM 25690 / JAM7) TaxID=754477 RepID=I1YL53_METFJ|nr:phosphoribosylanthranilate isomerase [Methylophaga frappieri]AFJ03646.1 Phosphoribosylanthranilate isomerase [Methylophaga frappieri]
MRTRVKICGITRRQDAEFAIEMGVDALGLVFYEPSPRAVTVAQAAELTRDLPPFVSIIGLFVDASPALINEVLDNVPVSMLQFHGDESPNDCSSYGLPYLKAIRMQENVSLITQAVTYQHAAGLLLDSYQVGVPGGTGKTFDWSRISPIDKPVILAGGLTPDNVRNAINDVNPYAVDVSGGVETAKGIKSHAKISAFMQEVANG